LMEKISVNEDEAFGEFAGDMGKKEALKGADLRKLGAFLKNKDDITVLGNLYRAVTDEGYVKWACFDYYRMNDQMNAAKEFQHVLDSIGGKRWQSGSEASIKSVYELGINFDWACILNDLEALEFALRSSRINSTLTTLDFYNNYTEVDGAKVLAEALKINSALITLNLYDNNVEFDGAGAPAEALKINLTRTTLSLNANYIGNDRVKALAEALKINSALITLYLNNNSNRVDAAKALAEALIGDNGAKALVEALKDQLDSKHFELELQPHRIRQSQGVSRDTQDQLESNHCVLSDVTEELPVK
ncbi:hypothetical protein BGW38_010755, partial [Lunasporangiospora selenospora]